MGIFVNENNELRWGRLIGTIIPLVIIILLLMSSIAIVPAGHVGVHDLFGKIAPTELPPGFHLKNPFASVHTMSVRTQPYTMSIAFGEGKKKKADAIDSLTKDGLTLAMDITVLYHLKGSTADEVYKKLGPEYGEDIIRPKIRTAIRDVVSKYTAKEIYSEYRMQSAVDMFDLMEPELEIRGIIVEEVLLRNVKLPTKLTQAIEEKLTAEQNIEKRAFEVEVEKQEAERKRVEAQGIADANLIIANSLTENYLRWYWIENLDSHNSTIYVPVGDGGIPLFREI